jgi:four helix bundle protein
VKRDNVVQEKSYAFALNIVKMCQKLRSEEKEYELARQLLKSGTSIGANIEEAIGAQSDKEFASKISVAYKEARETHYWLRLLKDSAILEKKSAESSLKDIDELLRIIGTIHKTVKQKLTAAIAIPNS